MRKYINVDLGTKKILVDIDEELLRKLRRTLKNNSLWKEKTGV